VCGQSSAVTSSAFIATHLGRGHTGIEGDRNSQETRVLATHLLVPSMDTTPQRVAAPSPLKRQREPPVLMLHETTIAVPFPSIARLVRELIAQHPDMAEDTKMALMTVEASYRTDLMRMPTKDAKKKAKLRIAGIVGSDKARGVYNQLHVQDAELQKCQLRLGCLDKPMTDLAYQRGVGVTQASALVQHARMRDGDAMALAAIAARGENSMTVSDLLSQMKHTSASDLAIYVETIINGTMPKKPRVNGTHEAES